MESPESSPYPLIQWFPGHIAKAQQTLKERIQLVDLVLELLDARIPASGRFSETRALISRKPSLLVLTKVDLADPVQTQAWLRRFEAESQPAIALNAQSGEGLNRLKTELAKVHDQITAKMKSRGRLPRPTRLMVVGLPNVGKSSLINRLVGKRRAPTGDKPGVTRAPAWIRLGKLELLDTPGIIPPKLSDPIGALKLAMTGSVSTEAYDPTEVSRAGIELIKEIAPTFLDPYQGSLEGFAEARGLIKAGGLDLERASRTFLSDFRSGALGRITLDPAAMASSPIEEETGDERS